MILGLDISTSTVGVTILHEDGSLAHIGFIKPIGTNMFEKVKVVTEQFNDLTQKFPITAIYAEAPNIMFRAGFSSAQVLATILRFNGALLFTLYDKLTILPKEAMAVSIRKQVIGVGRFKSNPKDEVHKWVSSQIPEYVWPTIDKGKNKGKLLPEVYDMADSYVVARYGLIHEPRNGQNQSSVNRSNLS